MRIITVKGTGNVSARPDYIILSLNIKTIKNLHLFCELVHEIIAFKEVFV
mgnify:CR=1 FL=1